MMGVSNNLIVKVLVSLMIISVGMAIAVPTFLEKNAGITGFVAGVIDVRAAKDISIDFVSGEVNFGSGYIAPGSTECIMDTEGGSSGCAEFSKATSLVLKNTGKSDAKVTIENKASSESFNGAKYYVKWSAEEGACTGGNMDQMKTYTELTKPLSLDSNVICGNLKKDATVKIDIRLKITDKTPIEIRDSFKAVAIQSE